MTEALLWVTAVSSVLTALVTGGLWWVAAKTLGGAERQLKLLQEQVRADARPYVVLEVVPGLHSAPAVDLVVRNSGRSMARDLVLEVDTWEPQSDSDYITERLLNFMATPRLLAPGSRLRVMWQSNQDADKNGAPESVVVTAVYTDDDGLEYRDEFNLDLLALLPAAPVPSQGPRATGRDKQLDNIEKAIRTLSTHLGELRR